MAGNWPEKLILWVKKWGEGETCVSEEVLGMETDHSGGNDPPFANPAEMAEGVFLPAALPHHP